MKYQVMGKGLDGKGEVVKFEGTADDREQMLAIAINLFSVNPWHWIVDEDGHIVESVRQARWMWGRTAIDEMKEALDDQ